jgi:hypothetical protein
MKHLPIRATPLATVLAVTAACALACFAGSTIAADDGEDSVADKVDPCKLITQAEAQSALGKPVKPGKFMDSIYRFCSFRPANGGTYYLSISLISIDKATFDKVDSRQFERAAGTNLDAFFAKNNELLSVWHAGNQMQIQVHFEDNAGQAGAKAAELKLATIAVTRF